MNFTSHGEYLYAGWFIQKTDHVGHSTLVIQDYQWWNRLQGPLIHRQRQTAKDQHEWRRGGVDRPHPLVSRPVGTRCQPILQREASTAFEDQSPLWFNFGSNRGTRWSCAMDSWAHRVPGDPYKRTPRPPLEIDHNWREEWSSRLGSILCT